MEKKFSVDETSELTTQLQAWLSEPVSEPCTELSLGDNCHLEPQVSAMLVNSPVMQTVTSLVCHEIYFSPEQLRELLTLPALESLNLMGGYSQDWSGPEYIWATLEPEHIEVLMHDPNARKLKTIALSNQRVSQEERIQLRQALPQLELLRIEYQNY